MNRFWVSGLVVTLALILGGCATVSGPEVKKKDVEAATEKLKVRALEYRIKQLQRVSDIGYRIASCLPKEDIKAEPAPYLGIACQKIDKYSKHLYGLSVDKGVVVVAVIKDSPAGESGIKPGDVICAIDGKKVKSVKSLPRMMRKMKIGESKEFDVMRPGLEEADPPSTVRVPITVGSMPKRLSFTMVDAQEVNAMASKDTIAVTYGLVSFAKNDDEIAAVLGHEIAHVIRGHVPKLQGGQILGLIAALALGVAAESDSPGSGESVARGAGEIAKIFNASYSRDLEREADYFGTKFVYYAGYDVDTCAGLQERFAIEIPQSMIQNYLSTHPCSPERMLRIKETIKELRATDPESQETQEE